jgi:hypothetical protein
MLWTSRTHQVPPEIAHHSRPAPLCLLCLHVCCVPQWRSGSIFQTAGTHCCCCSHTYTCSCAPPSKPLCLLPALTQVRATLSGARAAAAAAATATAAEAAATGSTNPAAAAAAAAAASLQAAGFSTSTSTTSSSGSGSGPGLKGFREQVGLPKELSKAVAAVLQQPELREPLGGLDGSAWCSEQFRQGEGVP